MDATLVQSKCRRKGFLYAGGFVCSGGTVHLCEWAVECVLYQSLCEATLGLQGDEK